MRNRRAFRGCNNDDGWGGPWRWLLVEEVVGMSVEDADDAALCCCCCWR